jgi:hypothetical protein
LVSPEARLVIVPPGTTAGRHRLWLLSATWQRYAWVLALTVFAETLLFTRAEWIFLITAAVAVWLLGSTLSTCWPAGSRSGRARFALLSPARAAGSTLPPAPSLSCRRI